MTSISAALQRIDALTPRPPTGALAALRNAAPARFVPPDVGGPEGQGAAPVATVSGLGRLVRWSADTLRLFEVRGTTEEDQAAFAGLIDRAEGQNPRAFARSLEADDLDLLRRVHGFADPVDPTGLSEEGAANLFQAPGNASNLVDLNDDGVVEVGRARIFAFPPPSAPQEVKDAWAKTRAARSPSDGRPMSADPFLVLNLEANIKYDAQGRAVGAFGPGDAGYRNPFGHTLGSYRDMTERLIARNEALRDRLPPQQYEDTRSVLTDFLRNLG